MRFLQLTADGVSDVEIDGAGVLCAHRGNVQLTADPETGQPNGLSLILTGHTSTTERHPGSSIALLDVETAAQIVLGIEASIASAPTDMQRQFVELVSQQRGGN